MPLQTNKPLRSLLAATMAVFALAAAGAADDVATPPEDSPAKADVEPKKEDAGYGMELPVPAGQPVKGIKVPFYGPDGTTLQMTVEADLARRIDDANIEMENMKIEAMSDDGAQIFVEMPRSVFNMEVRMLAGENGVIIKRDDFEISGRAGEFDLKTRFGKVMGNVKMIIMDAEVLE
jgi:hypothetical protein